MWVIPPKQNAAFVANMEDVLDLSKPHDPQRPVLCVDEGGQFTTANARIKLHKLYPTIQLQ